MRFIITSGPDGSQPSKEPVGADGSFDPELFAKYMKFNEDMHEAGVLVASEGINPGRKGARVGVAGGKRKVLDGPFTEAKELIGGFYIVDVASLDEAISWALRCPVGFDAANLLEIRPLTDLADIPRELQEMSAKVAPAWTASVTNPRAR
jgi:hypothetical protein